MPTPVVAETDGIISPYNLFSTLILKTVTTATEPIEPVTKTIELERTDSHDSFVNIKSTDTAAPPLTWTGYFSSFVWKQPEEIK